MFGHTHTLRGHTLRRRVCTCERAQRRDEPGLRLVRCQGSGAPHLLVRRETSTRGHGLWQLEGTTGLCLVFGHTLRRRVCAPSPLRFNRHTECSPLARGGLGPIRRGRDVCLSAGGGGRCKNPGAPDTAERSVSCGEFSTSADFRSFGWLCGAVGLVLFAFVLSEPPLLHCIWDLELEFGKSCSFPAVVWQTACTRRAGTCSSPHTQALPEITPARARGRMRQFQPYYSQMRRNEQFSAKFTTACCGGPWRNAARNG